MQEHEHGHEHDAHTPITNEHTLTPYEKRAYAIQALLIEKGVITADEVRRAVEDMSEEELASLVTRDSMIGVARARSAA